MLEEIISIVRRAGGIVRGAHDVERVTSEKSCSEDLVTEYDTGVQAFLRKELLALLIDRQGLSMTNGEIEAFLWEELHSPQYLQTLFYSLRKTLRGIGFEDLLIRTRNHTSIDVSKLHCDLYEFLKGSADAVNSYAGEYMNNYSWAELTNARLYNGTFSDFVLAAQARSRR